jgi:hypothetical protein
MNRHHLELLDASDDLGAFAVLLVGSFQAGQIRFDNRRLHNGYGFGDMI